ncbi:chitinase-like protein [Arabidopsis thaliana]|uniref:Chitinase-like protein n=1 Tax=Arabidopsis thaliana TaxID=3702 RepID=O81857_ARATH|nr:chitinase-like protein [Arabidopsis thaliana]CAB78978.1 chitinase-like protein [Arabidopsis thaliana]
MADQTQFLRTNSIVKASYWFPDGKSQSPECLSQGTPSSFIDSTLFTHLFCAFADVDSSTHEVTISAANSYQFSSFTETVKEKNTDVQTLLSIGGKDADKAVLASMASNSKNRKAFIDSSIDIARKKDFYGLDLAWEYPSNDVEMTNFGKLLEEWRAAVVEESDKTNQLPLLLTAAVYYSPQYDGVEYPVKAIADNLDFVNIMAYDFYGPGWSPVTGPPAALFHDPSNPAGRSGNSGLRKWLDEAKLPPKKAVLGFPYCGWAWTLEDAENNGYDAATDGAAISPDGSITYAKIRNYIVDNGAATFHDPAVIGFYCYVGNTWIGYDDNQSIVYKVKYAKFTGLLGYFSWHVGADYNCGLSRAGSFSF